MKSVILIAALLLAGCGVTPRAIMEYGAGERVVIPTDQSFDSQIRDLEVGFHPKIEGQAAVSPRNLMSIMMSDYDEARWLARVDKLRPGYDAALLSALSQRGEDDCSITTADLHPGAFMIEYRYTCTTSSMPQSEPVHRARTSEPAHP